MRIYGMHIIQYCALTLQVIDPSVNFQGSFVELQSIILGTQLRYDVSSSGEILSLNIIVDPGSISFHDFFSPVKTLEGFIVISLKSMYKGCLYKCFKKYPKNNWIFRIILKTHLNRPAEILEGLGVEAPVTVVPSKPQIGCS